MESYMDLLTDRNHWLFEITASVMQDIVILLVLAIVWPKIRATVSTLHMRFDKAHNLGHGPDSEHLQAQANQLANQQAAIHHLAVFVNEDAPAKVTVSYDHDISLARDVSQARAQLTSEGVEVPTWLSSRVSTAHKTVKS